MPGSVGSRRPSGRGSRRCRAHACTASRPARSPAPTHSRRPSQTPRRRRWPRAGCSGRCCCTPRRGTHSRTGRRSGKSVDASWRRPSSISRSVMSRSLIRGRWFRAGINSQRLTTKPCRNPVARHPEHMRVLVIEDDAEMAETVAAGRRSRVLMLTAAATMDDLVDGLGLGADDYLPKPFDFPVLLARLGALARRAQPAIPPVLCHGDLRVDTGQRRAWRGARQLDLAPKEFGVLELLLGAGGRTVSTEELLERVWDEHTDPFTNAVKITISRLRTKL